MESFLGFLFSFSWSARAVMAAYVIVGVCTAVLVYRRFKRSLAAFLATSFVCAVFFSFSLVVDRTAIPLPTPLVFAVWIADGASREPKCWEPCTQPEGCCEIPEGEVSILLPFIVQWVFWLLLLLLCLGRPAPRNPEHA